MKINFSEAEVKDFEGNIIKIDMLPHKRLADHAGKSGFQIPGLTFHDNMDLFSKINRGEVIDLETLQQEAMKGYIETQLPVINFLKMALLECLSKPEKQSNRVDKKQTAK